MALRSVCFSTKYFLLEKRVKVTTGTTIAGSNLEVDSYKTGFNNGRNSGLLNCVFMQLEYVSDNRATSTAESSQD